MRERVLRKVVGGRRVESEMKDIENEVVMFYGGIKVLIYL